jgi:hypothetical protein
MDISDYLKGLLSACTARANHKRRVMWSVAALSLLFSASLSAATVTISASGTFSSSTANSTFSAPNQTWAFSFLVQSIPSVSNVNTGNYFDVAFSHFSYSLNGSPAAITPVDIRIFSASQHGGFDICFSASCSSLNSPANGFEFKGGQMYTGPESAPTISTGAFTSTLSDAFVNSALYSQPPHQTVAVVQDVLTYHNDVARTGQNLAETTLTTSNVNSTTFGKLFQVTLDGRVDGQPLYLSGVQIANQGMHNVLIVATENDSLYALDADTGAPLWNVALLAAGETPSDDIDCSLVTPQIGITSTPVIGFESGSSPRGAIFVVAMSKDSAGNYHQRLYQVGPLAGKVLASVEITAKYPGTGDYSDGGYVFFDPRQYLERSALLLQNGVVYLAWSSHCDTRPYTGWIMGYNAVTLAQTSVINVTPNGSEGAIWMSGAGLSADSSGYLYLLDANGTFDTTLNSKGFPANGDFGNAFIKLSAAGNQLTVADYFAMDNTANESGKDEDLGSGGALVLPDMTDTNGNVRHLAVGAGKDTNIYLADRDNMGKFNSADNNAIYQVLNGALPDGLWSMPAYYNGQAYFGCIGYMRAFQFSAAKLSSTPVSETSTIFHYPGTIPSISANGSTNGIVWAVENASPAILHAYSADNLAQELYNSNEAANGRDQFGAFAKFVAPTIANGKVYLGTPTGVAAFGLR